MHKHALLPAFAAALLAAFALPGWAATTFVVSVPASTPAGETVYIAGSFQGWNSASPAHALTRQVDGRWSITLDLPAGTAIQYKFTRGSWARVEKGVNGEEIANRNLTPSGSQTVECTVARCLCLWGISGGLGAAALLSVERAECTENGGTLVGGGVWGYTVRCSRSESWVDGGRGCPTEVVAASTTGAISASVRR